MNTKRPMQSLTIQGAVVVLASFIINQLDLDVSNQELVDVISAIGVLVGWGMTVWGRLRANTVIKK